MLTIFAKSFDINIWPGSKYTSDWDKTKKHFPITVDVKTRQYFVGYLFQKGFRYLKTAEWLLEELGEIIKKTHNTL